MKKNYFDKKKKKTEPDTKCLETLGRAGFADVTKLRMYWLAQF